MTDRSQSINAKRFASLMLKEAEIIVAS